MKDHRKLLLIAACVVPLILAIRLAMRYVVIGNPPCRYWAVSFLPDGNTLATVGGSSNPDELPYLGELVIWDLATGKEKLIFRQKSSVRALACSPRGDFIAIGDFSGSTKLVAIATGKVIAVLPPHAGLVNAVAVAADGKMIACANFNGTITLWHPADKKRDLLILPDETIINVALAPGSDALAATTRKGNIYLFDLTNNRKQPQKLPAYQGPAMDEPSAEAVAFSPDGRSFATGCQNTLRLWEAGTGRLIRDLTGNRASINSVTFSPNGKILASVDSNGDLSLWDALAGKRVKSISAHLDTSFCVAFAADGKRLATIGRYDFNTKIWDAETLTLITTLRRENAP